MGFLANANTAATPWSLDARNRKGLLNLGGSIAQFKRNRCSISPVEMILQSGICRIFHTGSKKVSGLFGSKTSLQVITVTRSSVSLRLMMLCVQPGIM